MPFYKPLKLEVRKIPYDVKGIPVIIYPHEDLGSVVNRNEKGAIENYVSKIYGLNTLNGLEKLGQYNIAIIWNKGQDVILNIWKYCENELGESELLDDGKTCIGLYIEPDIDIFAKDSFRILEREAEHKAKNTLEEFLTVRPRLPSKLTTNEAFYFADFHTKL